jgi:two-component system sensor histidine kinase UhpB
LGDRGPSRSLQLRSWSFGETLIAGISGWIAVSMNAGTAVSIDAGSHSEREQASTRRYVPLVVRVAGVNALLLLAAVVVTILVLGPGRFSSFAAKEVVVLVAALVLMAVVNLLLLRRIVGPLQALTDLARRVDLANPGERMPGGRPTSEAGELAMTFNEMLERLESERREATGRVLAAQEAERLRIAQELHDQVGQELTAVLLVLSRLQNRVADSLRSDVVEIQEEVRASLEDVRRIAVELRPEALDDLGLVSALAVLGQRFAERSALEVVENIAPDIPTLSGDTELVVYRVAQEALTNVARHSGSQHAEVNLGPANGRLVLTVSDRGRGLAADHAPGAGMRGMRERAALIGATLRVSRGPGPNGCQVRLEVPLEDQR